MYTLLVLSTFMCGFSYIRVFLFAEGDVNQAYPQKFLVKNKFILRYFFNPKYPITKHYTIFHFILLFYFILVLTMYAIYWIAGSNPILESSEFRYYNLIGLAVFTVTFYLIVCFLEHKYQKL